MSRAIRVAVILYIALELIAAVYAQDSLYQLSPGEYLIAASLGFVADTTLLSGDLSYVISRDLIGSLGGGLVFVAEDLVLPGISIPPMHVFSVGLGSSDKLGQTGLDYWTSVDLGIMHGRFVDDITDQTIMTSRAIDLSSRIGVAKEIPIQSGLTLIPSAGISYDQTWTTSESEIMNFSETERDSTWLGQIGLAVGVSPKMRIVGLMGFSFERSDIVYSIGLSFKP